MINVTPDCLDADGIAFIIRYSAVSTSGLVAHKGSLFGTKTASKKNTISTGHSSVNSVGMTWKKYSAIFLKMAG
jgi:hypothetical protein